MAELIIKLRAYGIPEKNLAIAFTESENAGKLPVALVDQRHDVREYLVQRSKLPPNVKIFITTSQNKERISIEDDDIKYMFSESHNKADLEQMAGRVRGNSETGTGIHTGACGHQYQRIYREKMSLYFETQKNAISKLKNEGRSNLSSSSLDFHFSGCALKHPDGAECTVALAEPVIGHLSIPSGHLRSECPIWRCSVNRSPPFWR